jgi:hypothetical protein
MAEQLNLLRVVDNERYPAFVELRDRLYELKIYAAPFMSKYIPPT